MDQRPYKLIQEFKLCFLLEKCYMIFLISSAYIERFFDSPIHVGIYVYMFHEFIFGPGNIIVKTNTQSFTLHLCFANSSL